MSGVKETKEVLVAVLKVAPILVKQFKDGAQIEDVAALYAKFMSDADLKAAVMAAYDNYKMVGDEVKDLETAEIIELIMAALPEIQKLLQEMKK